MQLGANAQTFRNAQTESGGRAVVTTPFESCGRGCNRAFGEVMPNTMKENKDTFFFRVGAGHLGNDTWGGRVARGGGRARSFFTPISLWRVLCEWTAVVTAPLLLPSSHDLSLHMQFRHSRQSTVVACHHLFLLEISLLRCSVVILTSKSFSMFSLVFEPCRQKATFCSSERFSKAVSGQ